MPRVAGPLARMPGAVWVVLLVSGVLGYRVGSVGFADWQVAVETAQVVAGLVTYPPDNPFFIYHTKLWTVLHEVCALLLHGGVSEGSLSIALSGLLGMVSFQAISLVVYALSRDPFLAVGSAFLVAFSRAAESGVIYPIVLAGSSNTYGVLGLSAIVLVAALFGSGCYRTGAFMLGFLPAIHLSLAAWFLLCLIPAALWDRRNSGEPLRRALPYLVAGFVLAVASFGAHVMLSKPVTLVEPQTGVDYLSTFVALWDPHRKPVDPTSRGVLGNVGVLVLSLIWLRWFARDLPRAAGLLIRVVVVSAVVSLVFVAISWVPPEHLPATLLVFMPARLLNFNAMIAPALLIGLIGAYRDVLLGQWLGLLFAVGLLLNERSLLWPWLQAHSRSFVRYLVPQGPISLVGVLAIAPLALLLVAEWHLQFACDRTKDAKAGVMNPAAARVLRGARLALQAGMFSVLFAAAWWTWQLRAPRELIFAEPTADPVLDVASRSEGLLLTGGNLHLVQLRTRRAVLLDGGGLDALPYAPEAAPQMVRILRDVYGIDFFNPPLEARGIGIVPNVANQVAWEAYSRAKWQEIRREYGVTQVMTYVHWILDLPVAAQGRSYVLYDIPE